MLVAMRDMPFHEALAFVRTGRGLAIPGTDSGNKPEQKRYLTYESGTVIPPGEIVRDLAQNYFHLSGSLEHSLYDKAIKARTAKRAASRRNRTV